MYRRDSPNLEFSPNRISIGFSQIAFPHNSPAKGWPYRFRSRGTTGSSILDHDLGHLCRGRLIQMSGHSDLGIFNNLWASSFFYLGIRWYCVCCLSIATWQSGDDIFDFCCCHLRCWWSLFGEYCIRSWVVFYNITSETRPLYLWCFASNSAFFKWHMSINNAKWNCSARRPCFIDHFFLTSSSGSTPNFSSIFPTPCPLLPLLLESS